MTDATDYSLEAYETHEGYEPVALPLELFSPTLGALFASNPWNPFRLQPLEPFSPSAIGTLFACNLWKLFRRQPLLTTPARVGFGPRTKAARVGQPVLDWGWLSHLYWRPCNWSHSHKSVSQPVLACRQEKPSSAEAKTGAWLVNRCLTVRRRSKTRLTNRRAPTGWLTGEHHDCPQEKQKPVGDRFLHQVTNGWCSPASTNRLANRRAPWLSAGEAIDSGGEAKT